MSKRFIAILIDVFVMGLILIILTAGDPIVSLYFNDIVRQNPWVHRLVLMGLSAVLFIVIAAQYYFTYKKETPISILIPLFKKIEISIFGWVVVVFFAFSILMFVSSVVRHEAFKSGFDMAIFVQAVWNTLRGDFLYSSIKGGICLLGDHFSPILAVLAVPYFFWTDPWCLLFLQAFAVGSCVFPIFKIARKVCDHSFWPILFVLMFALYLPVRNSIRFDFHPELLIMPLLFWAFYFMIKDRKTLASVFLLFSLLGKENVALVTFAMGFYAFVFLKRGKIWGAAWMIFSIVYFFIITRWVIPMISGDEYFYLKGNFSEWKNLGFQAFLGHLLRPEVLAYLVKIFGPLAFLSILSPSTLLLTFPMLAQNIMARNEMTLSIFFQYTALLTPFVFIAAIYGADRIKGAKFSLSVFFVSVLFMGVSEYYLIANYSREWHPRYQLIKETADELNKLEAVRTHEFLAPHFAHRKELHIYENNHPKEGGNSKALSSKWVVLDKQFMGRKFETAISSLQKRGYVVKNDYSEELAILTN